MRPNEWSIKTRLVDRPDLRRLRLNGAEVSRRIDEKLDREMQAVCSDLGLNPRAWMSGGKWRR